MIADKAHALMAQRAKSDPVLARALDAVEAADAAFNAPHEGATSSEALLLALTQHCAAYEVIFEQAGKPITDYRAVLPPWLRESVALMKAAIRQTPPARPPLKVVT